VVSLTSNRLFCGSASLSSGARRHRYGWSCCSAASKNIGHWTLLPRVSFAEHARERRNLHFDRSFRFASKDFDNFRNEHSPSGSAIQARSASPPSCHCSQSNPASMIASLQASQDRLTGSSGEGEWADSISGALHAVNRRSMFVAASGDSPGHGNTLNFPVGTLSHGDYFCSPPAFLGVFSTALGAHAPRAGLLVLGTAKPGIISPGAHSGGVTFWVVFFSGRRFVHHDQAIAHNRSRGACSPHSKCTISPRRLGREALWV
jgi:hypothetical protein